MTYRRLVLPTVLTLCGLLTLSCGDSRLTRTSDAGASPDVALDADQEVGPSGNTEVSRFGAQTLQAHCQKLFDCCSGEELDEIMGDRSESVEACADSANAVFSALAFGEYDQAVADGRMEFDADAAQLCIDSWAERSCGELNPANIFNTDLPGCREAVSGTVELGGECIEDLDCKVGYCLGDGDDNSSCARLPEAGQPCPELRCADDAYCSTFGQEYSCVAKRDLEQGCQLDRDCKSGLCTEDENLDLVCQTKPLVCEGG